ncbi:hypothetical protein U2F10_18560 [Leptothoe sp. EHU-05/26/07-4]
MKNSFCPASNKNSQEIDCSQSFWRLLKTVSRYLGIPNRHIKKRKKRFYTLKPDQQRLVTQTWIRIGHLQDYGIRLGFLSNEGIIFLSNEGIIGIDSPLDVLTILFETAEHDIDTAIWQWTVTKDLLNRVSAMKAIEEIWG